MSHATLTAQLIAAEHKLASASKAHDTLYDQLERHSRGGVVNGEDPTLRISRAAVEDAQADVDRLKARLTQQPHVRHAHADYERGRNLSDNRRGPKRTRPVYKGRNLNKPRWAETSNPPS